MPLQFFSTRRASNTANRLITLAVKRHKCLAPISVLEQVVTIKGQKSMTIKRIVFLAVSVPVLLLLITASFFTLFRPDSYSSMARVKVQRDTTDIPTSLSSGGHMAGICVPYVVQRNKIELWPERNSNMMGIKFQ
jgi:hypothetical protein